jgi:rubrerythrin
MSLKPKLSWVAEEEAAHHRKLKNLMGGEGWLMIFFARVIQRQEQPPNLPRE